MLRTDGDAQERRGYRGPSRIGARVLRVEQVVEFIEQVVLATDLFGGFECVHRRAVVGPEGRQELSWRYGRLEREGVRFAGDLVSGDPRPCEPLDNVGLDSPCHRADEPLGRWRRVR